MASWIKSSKTAEPAAGHFGRDVLLGTTCLFAVAGLSGAAEAGSLPTHGHYVAGDGSISKTNQSLTVKQSSTTGIINWSSFSVGGKNRVTFDNGSGATLNRVTGGNLSTIAGSLHATGSLYLMNAQGVVISGSGRVVTGGSFVATSGNIPDTAFGDTRFKPGAGKIVNRGTIIGYGATLSGRDVSDTGTIRASQINLTAQHKLAIDGALSARNADGSGGTIIATAKHIAVGSGANISASGTKGGTVLIGGDIHGGSIASDNFVQQNVRTAETNFIAKGAHISANGGSTSGGNIVIWSDGHTTFGGKISATGQTAGGFAEVSSHDLLGFAGKAALTSARGKTGTLLLDPYDVLISSDADQTDTNSGQIFTPSGNTSIISVATLEAALANTNVEVETGGTGSPGSQQGNIAIISPLTWSANTALVLDAQNSIVIGAPVTIKGLAELELNYGGTFNTVNGVGSVTFTNMQSDLLLNGISYTLENSLSGLASAIAASPSGDFALASSITAPTTAYATSPLGGFSGALEGLGNSIIDLKIDDTTQINVGLFSATNSGSAIRDLNLVDPSVTVPGSNARIGALVGINGGTLSFDSVVGGKVSDVATTSSGDFEIGGLAGENHGAIVSSTASDAAVGGEAADIGGLTGVNEGSISHSSASGAVSATTGSVSAGGLVGLSFTTVTSSYATGNVTATGAGDVGGLVGDNDNGSAVSDSYASGNAKGGAGSRVGGLAGENDTSIVNTYALGSATGGGSGSDVGGLVGNNSAGTITASYSVGKVGSTGTNDLIGGYIGDNTGTVVGGYFDTDTPTSTSLGSGTFAAVGADSEVGITGLTTAQMMAISNMPGMTFGSTAGADGFVLFDVDGGLNNSGAETGATLPMLLAEATPGNNIHIVQNAHQLQLIDLDVDGTYFLGGAINMSATASGKNIWSAGNGYIAPGQQGAVPFEGDLFGLGETISNLFSAGTQQGFVGLIGFQEGGRIENLKLAGVDISDAASEAGAVAGNAEDGAVDEDLTVSGTVSSTNDIGFVGGAFGFGDGTFTNIVSSVVVTGTDDGFDGGLIGRDDGGTIAFSHATGNVTGVSGSIGGLVGQNVATITSSYATGNVTGTNNANLGGLVGTSSGMILQSHATGDVAGDDEGHIGGLAGINTGGIQTSYATGAVSAGLESQTGGFVGNNIGGILTSYASGKVTAGPTGTSQITNALSSSGGFFGYNDSVIVASYATGNVTVLVTQGGAQTGGFGGTNDASGTVSQDHASGAVTANSDQTASGGLIGVNTGNVEESYATGAIDNTGTDGFSGGLVAINTGSIGGAFSTGNVSGQFNVGGFVGFNEGSIAEAYELGAVTETALNGGVGAFVADNASSATIGQAYATGSVNSNGGGRAAGFAGENDNTSATAIQAAYWDTETTGMSSGLATGTAQAGIVGKTTAQLQAALPTGFDPADWKIVAGKSFAYLDWQAPSGTPEVISGTVSGTGNAGIGVGVLVNGQSATPLASMASGANGYYYELLTPGTITSSGSDVVVYKKTGSHANVFDLGAKGSLTGLNLAPNTLTVDSAAASSSAMLSAMNTAVGSFANSNYLYTAAGSFTSGIDLDLDLSAASFNINSAIDLGTGELVLDAAGKVSQGSASTITAAKLTGSSDGEVLLNSTTNLINNLAAFTTGSNTLELTDDRTLTVDGLVDAGSVGVHLTTVGAGHNIVLDNKIHADDLYLVSSGAVSESGTGDINVAKVLGSSVGTAQMTSALNVIGALGTFTSGSTFQIASDRSLAVEGVVNAGTAGAHVTTVGAGHAIVVDAKIAAGAVYLVSSGTIKEAATGDIDAVKLLGSSVNATSLNSSLNTITDLGAFSTNGTAAFELTDDHGLTVDGAVSAGTGTLDLTTVGAGHNLAINANITGGTINLVTTGSASEASTAAIAAAKLNVTAKTGINLTSTHNAITKLGTDKTNTGQNKVTL